MTNNILAHALRYATILPGTLLPVELYGKKPAIGDWPNRATCDADTLTDWFNGERCSLGWQPGEGYFVLDIDVKASFNGNDTLEALIARHGELPDTLQQRTPTGGEHWVFRLPPGVKAKNIVGSKSGFPGLDIRTKGGQIVVEPSVRPEGVYKWIGWNPLDEACPEIADATAWLVKFACGELEPIDGVKKRKAVQVGNDGGIVEAGGRNAALVQEACALRRKGWSEAVIVGALLELNRAQFRPPVPENEVRDVVAWACGKYQATPGADIAEIHGTDDWASLLDTADGDAGAVTVIVRKVQAATTLSEIERGSLFKRAAKAAGCNIAAIRAEAAKSMATAMQSEETAGELLPSIRVSAGDFSSAVDEAVRLLPSLDLFQQGGRLVQVLPTIFGGARVESVELPNLSYLLSRAATWRRAGAEGLDTPTSPDRDLVAAVQARKWWAGIRPLAGIARQPLLQKDGSLAPAGGYCPEAMHLMAFSPTDFPAWEGTPQDALALLLDLLNEFPFESGEDRAAAVAGMLTGALRKSLDTAPGFFAKAHAAGSSKSYLSTLLALFAGKRTASSAWAEAAGEQRKALLSLLLDNPDAIVFDNLERDLSSPHLARALTESTYRDRALGQSKSPEASAQVLFVANGNNCGPAGDICRRMLSIRLDPKSETPYTRSFANDPVRQVEAERGRYVMAALAIVQGWMAAASPKASLKSIASYNAWSDWVRQPLVWLGLPDPGARLLENAAQGDPERETLSRLLRLWAVVVGGEAVAVRHVLREVASGRCYDDDRADLRETLIEIAGERDEINPKRLGWWLKSKEGCIVSGYKLVKHEGGQRTAWQVVGA